METNVHIDRVEIHTQIEGKPLFLTVSRAAEETGFSTSYVRKLIQTGQLPHFKGEGTNGRVLIRTDELIGFMELRRVTAPASP